VGTDQAGVASYDGSKWKVYNSSNSGMLMNDPVEAIAIDNIGMKWFGTDGGGIARYNNIDWKIFNTSNSGLPADIVKTLAVDKSGTAWFGFHHTGSEGGVASYDGSTWTVYDTSNSELPSDDIYSIAVDEEDILWIGTDGKGAASFDGDNWIVYNSSNSVLSDYIEVIYVDQENVKWFGGSDHIIFSFDGIEWEEYDTLDTGIYGFGNFQAIAVDKDFDKWFGAAGGLFVVYGGKDYIVNENQGWESPTRFRAIYDINSLISRENYIISVSGVLGEDNIEIALNEASTFTVDYAGPIGDKTPPPEPQVTACAGSSIGTLYAHWSASDPDSSITLYQYAIGTSSGGSDVVNWTNTTETSFERTGLGLIAGQTYFISVKARNEGGLWSKAGTPPGVVAGSGTCTNTFRYTYLPIIHRNYID
jgi:hypothetical protein